MKKTNILESELQRFKEINRYAKKLLKEQEDETDDLAGNTPPEDAEIPDEPETESPEDEDIPPSEDTEIEPTEEDDTTEELDITELVNMIKSTKKAIVDKTDDSGETEQKMDDIFSKLNDLEQKLSLMDSMVEKIEGLNTKIEEIKEPTPKEELEMRSLDSYPYNDNPKDFFSAKQDEMRKTGKNEYVLTKNDVENYSKNQITKTFNPDSGKGEGTNFR